MPQPAPYPRLLADVGGTNARFAWLDQPGSAMRAVRALPTQDHASLAHAARAYLADEALPAPAAMAMGIATAITGDTVRMTNHHWSFSQQALQADLGLQRLAVINDFTALALALPALDPADLHQFGGGQAVAGSPVAVIGPGTGLGVSGLLPTGDGRWVPIAGEGGHATLAASTDREAALLAVLRQRFGHASAERAISGAGLVSLYEAVCEIDGLAPHQLAPADVTQRALAGSNPACLEALQVFCELLGTMASNLALMLGARGGVYIGGGIVPRLGEFFLRSGFRARFEDKGRYRSYLAPIPVFIIRATDSPALLGANRALD